MCIFLKTKSPTYLNDNVPKNEDKPAISNPLPVDFCLVNFTAKNTLLIPNNIMGISIKIYRDWMSIALSAKIIKTREYLIVKNRYEKVMWVEYKQCTENE